ncbi:MAG: L-histidine N(alpha)-methyltransferase [Gammaproteobacteria bacterium]|jgi:dimethylhistidine N-methyltransferase
MMTEVSVAEIRFSNANPGHADLYSEIFAGLSRRPCRIPPKFFYDEEGSRLFERICEQPEYYPTRTETALLQQVAGEITELAGGTGCYLVEPGSGSCEKVRTLLNPLKPDTYIPMDISCEHLRQAAHSVASEYPWLEVHAVCADITDTVSLPFIPEHATRVVFYPGSSIGNFEPFEAATFLGDLARLAGPNGGVLVGVDLKKDPAVLNAAYNDARGITAAFNLNLLKRINRELDGDFDIASFEHCAFYNETAGRIEMHLISNRRQTVHIDGHRFEFERNEHIHTENSYKYTIGEFQALARRAGLIPCAVWTDSAALFSLHFLRRARGVQVDHG